MDVDAAVAVEVAEDREAVKVSVDQDEVAEVTFKGAEATSMNAEEVQIFAAEEEIFVVAVAAEVGKLAREAEDFAGVKEEVTISAAEEDITLGEGEADEASDKAGQKSRRPVVFHLANPHHGQRANLHHPSQSRHLNRPCQCLKENHRSRRRPRYLLLRLLGRVVAASRRKRAGQRANLHHPSQARQVDRLCQCH